MWLSKPFPFILYVALASTALGPARAASHTLTVTPAALAVKARSQVRLKIEFKNISNHDIEMTSVPWGKEDHSELEGFIPTVTDSDGQQAPLTKWGRLVAGRPNPSDNPNHLTFQLVATISLPPGRYIDRKLC
jgi:hypothetical protein